VKPAWKQPSAGDIVITDGQGTQVPVTVKGFAAGSIEPLQRLTRKCGISLVHDGSWPPIAVISWAALSRLVQIGMKPTD
jgi:hypothetical protein